MTNPHAIRLQQLRQAMDNCRLDAYLIPSSDAHQSEYVAEHWQGRAWVSGFTGSAGLLTVSPDEAAIWTDSRYFIQAEAQLKDTGIVLRKQSIPHAPEHLGWLAQNLAPGSTLGIAGDAFSVAQVRALQSAFKPKNISINAAYDLLDDIWAERPALPKSTIFRHDVALAGQSSPDKLAAVRQWMLSQQVDALLLPALDDIAWALNIRAADVDFNPVCISYLLVLPQRAVWFVGQYRVTDGLHAELAAEGIEVATYNEVAAWCNAHLQGQRLSIDPNTTNFALYNQLQGIALHEADSPVQAMKAVKNATELRHWQQAMRHDGVALVQLLMWLEQEVPGGQLTEAAVADKIADLRAAQPHYVGESFPAIVGYAGNGAIVHYRPEHGHCATIRPEGILLIDSGGQYLNGTTDITRTVALGTPTAQQQQHYTLVLKGMIALSRAQFPAGTGGAQLDTLARMHLWQHHLNYGHGTGHGVGYFLNVHEGPQGFAPSIVTSRGRTAFVPGMVTSNEPGFYLEGQYGIRIENLVVCEAAGKAGFGEFLRFRTLTLCPIDTQLVDTSLLDEAEKDWLNAYHKEVLDELLPLLKHEEERTWLIAACRMI